MQEPIYINEVQFQETLIDGVDWFEIEWFETQKHLFKRKTKQGIELHIERKQGHIWKQGDALYYNGGLLAQVVIKPTLTIQFSVTNGAPIADFTYYIGNRHLPIFIEKETNQLLVPYDGQLYEQVIAKFPTYITLVKQPLHATMLLTQQQTQV
ncbi:urease accessory protein UreE [Myroides sp. TSA_177.3]|uniref:urease accessory protein UreE n=1 Tax=Myroides sp. TSA_177.3 TaxID=3415650 RepID=UPI0040463FAC